MDFIRRIFLEGEFMPHGMCYLWQPGILSLHIVSDALITVAYYSIPLTLVYFVRQRRDLVFHWVFLCFAVFIVACGTTHLMEIWVIWHPAYWVSGTIKAITALVSVPTAILLVKLVPQALLLPSPATLQKANAALEQEIAERKRAQSEIASMHERLLVTSRASGMADVASSVLHNVGNALNSVTVSASLVAERLRKSKGAGIGRLAELLQQHAGAMGPFLESPQGRQLPIYLRELATQWAAEQDDMAVELAELRRNVEQIKEIVAMQQSYAKRGGFTEMLDVRLLVEDGLRMNAAALKLHGISVVRNFAAVPPICVDKHKVLQILVNLIQNAQHACEAASGADRRLTVRIATADDFVLISIADTGVGIPKENLTRIFSQGFTTRATGHGLGLHSSALAASDCGGSLRAASAGAGQGATFTLELPLMVAKARTAGLSA